MTHIIRNSLGVLAATGALVIVGAGGAQRRSWRHS
jgi:hypothetical protein